MPCANKKTPMNDVEGWLTKIEGSLLYNLAKKCTGKGVIVEIGSWKGKSTVCLGRGSKEGKRITVYAVDPHGTQISSGYSVGENTLGTFKRNIKKAGIDDMVVAIVSRSKEAARNFNKPVELIFIDGAHDYVSVKTDFDSWFPKVVENGRMAFHDSTELSGPKRVVKDCIFKSRQFRNIIFVDSITVAEKVSQNSLREYVKNRFVLFLKTASEMALRLRPPRWVRVIGKRIVWKLLRMNGELTRELR